MLVHQKFDRHLGNILHTYLSNRLHNDQSGSQLARHTYLSHYSHIRIMGILKHTVCLRDSHNNILGFLGKQQRIELLCYLEILLSILGHISQLDSIHSNLNLYRISKHRFLLGGLQNSHLNKQLHKFYFHHSNLVHKGLESQGIYLRIYLLIYPHIDQLLQDKPQHITLLVHQQSSLQGINEYKYYQHHNHITQELMGIG